MIVRRRPSALGLLFILRGSIVPTIAPRVFVVLVLSAAVAWLHRAAPQYFRDLTPAPFTLLGLALSIFFGFRNNACYERWWEGRKQWGQLIAESRGLVREGVTLLPDEPAIRRRLTHRVIAFAHALRGQLRGTEGAELHDWLPSGEWDWVARHRSRPDAILLAQSDELQHLLRRGQLSDILYRLFSDRLQAMTHIQTACERLRSTPTPFTYTLLLHRTAWLFCLLLPFGLVGTLGMVTPVVSTILAYAFFGLEHWAKSWRSRSACRRTPYRSTPSCALSRSLPLRLWERRICRRRWSRKHSCCFSYLCTATARGRNKLGPKGGNDDCRPSSHGSALALW